MRKLKPFLMVLFFLVFLIVIAKLSGVPASKFVPFAN